MAKQRHYYLTLRTDRQDAEIALYDGNSSLNSEQWQAHRQLAETIHKKIAALLQKQGIGLNELSGIAVYLGPGSFTGLRIGISVSNAIAYANNIPIAGGSGNSWLDDSIGRLIAGKNDKQVMPEYGSEVFTTLPRK